MLALGGRRATTRMLDVPGVERSRRSAALGWAGPVETRGGAGPVEIRGGAGLGLECRALI